MYSPELGLGPDKDYTTYRDPMTGSVVLPDITVSARKRPDLPMLIALAFIAWWLVTDGGRTGRGKR